MKKDLHKAQAHQKMISEFPSNPYNGSTDKG